MRKDAKEYMNSVAEVIASKYYMSGLESYKMVKKSFLYESLVKFSEETLHDDIETNADLIYQDYMAEKILEM